jgi:hypothetical protein
MSAPRSAPTDTGASFTFDSTIADASGFSASFIT